MRTKMFTVLDTVAGVYQRPFTARSHGEALRAFTDLANDANHPVGQHPADYSLYAIGEFDEDTGELSSESPYHLGVAKTYVRKAGES